MRTRCFALPPTRIGLAIFLLCSLLWIGCGHSATPSVNTGQSDPLLQIQISPSSPTLNQGQTVQLAATAVYQSGKQQDVTGSATWATSAAAVATVGNAGALTAVGAGSAKITAQYQTVTGNIAVTVSSVTLQTITVTPASSQVPVGESQQLSATGTYSDATTKDLTGTVTWTSSQTSIAGVSANGLATANASGVVTINATWSSITGTAQITVMPAAAVGLTISPGTSSMLLGSSQQLHATFNYSDGTSQDATNQVVWSSATPYSVSVSNGGLAVALQVGSATVSASADNLNADAAITVNPLTLVSYFDLTSTQTANIDGTVRLINPGLTGGDLCAMIYVFDSNQEMNECCGCKISDAGLLTLSLENDLTGNPLTGVKPGQGVIQIVSSDPTSNPQCDATSLSPTGQLAGWTTNAYADSSGAAGVVESPSHASTLTSNASSTLGGTCAALRSLGSGQGVCSCGSGDTAP